MIIGLVGKSGSGKDTVAQLLYARRMSFADPLKEFCQQVFGWDTETLWGASDRRNQPDPRYTRPCGLPLTPRYALQTLGSNWGRSCDPDIWVTLGLRRARQYQEDNPGAVVVFTDCRYVNEARAIREAGGEVWRIIRPGAGLSGEAGAHDSETEQDSPEMNSQITATIENNGTIADLRARLATLHR